jgi:DNA-binding transcriptional ArsR family regulator
LYQHSIQASNLLKNCVLAPEPVTWQYSKAMPETTQPTIPVPVTQDWSPDVVFAMLADPARRRALLAIARTQPQAATSLTGASGKRMDATLKHLITLREAGMLTTSPDPKDGRRTLYGLSPKMKIIKSAQGAVLDFGCCIIPLG